MAPLPRQNTCRTTRRVCLLGDDAIGCVRQVLWGRIHGILVVPKATLARRRGVLVVPKATLVSRSGILVVPEVPPVSQRGGRVVRKVQGRTP